LGEVLLIPGPTRINNRKGGKKIDFPAALPDWLFSG